MNNDLSFDIDQLIDAIKTHPGLKTDSDRERIDLIFDKMKESGIIKYLTDVYPIDIAAVKLLALSGKAIAHIFPDMSNTNNVDNLNKTNKEIIEENDLWFVKTVISLHSYDPERYQLNALADILDPNINNDIGETVELRSMRYNIIFLITDHICKSGIMDIIANSVNNQDDMFMYILSILDNYIYYVAEIYPERNNPEEFIMSLLDVEYCADDYFPQLSEQMQINGVRSIKVPHFIREMYNDE